MNNPFAFLATSGYASPPPPMYPPQNPYAAPTGYAPQQGYDQQAGYNPQGGYAPAQGYAPQGGYDPQAGYNPQMGYVPQMQFAPQAPPPYMMAPPPIPAGGGGSMVPAVLMLVAGIMAVIALVAPMASISVMGLSFNFNLWGASILGQTMYWWSLPTGSTMAAQVGLLISGFVMGLLGLIFCFCASGLMFARKNASRILAILAGIFCILGVALFWVGLTSLEGFSSLGVSPSVGTFTLVIGAIMAFIGGVMFKPAPAVPIMMGAVPGMGAPQQGYMPPSSPPPYPPY